MAKEINKKLTLQIEAGKATPAPPVGTVLGPAGINLQEDYHLFEECRNYHRCWEQSQKRDQQSH